VRPRSASAPASLREVDESPGAGAPCGRPSTKVALRPDPVRDRVGHPAKQRLVRRTFPFAIQEAADADCSDPIERRDPLQAVCGTPRPAFDPSTASIIAAESAARPPEAPGALLRAGGPRGRHHRAPERQAPPDAHRSRRRRSSGRDEHVGRRRAARGPAAVKLAESTNAGRRSAPRFPAVHRRAARAAGRAPRQTRAAGSEAHRLAARSPPSRKERSRGVAQLRRPGGGGPGWRNRP